MANSIVIISRTRQIYPRRVRLSVPLPRRSRRSPTSRRSCRSILARRRRHRQNLPRRHESRSVHQSQRDRQLSQQAVARARRVAFTSTRIRRRRSRWASSVSTRRKESLARKVVSWNRRRSATSSNRGPKYRSDLKFLNSTAMSRRS